MSDVINKELQLYIEQHIIPQYDLLDESHSSIHVEQVIQNSFEIMTSYQVNQDMVYTVAAFHDIGMLYGRKLHEVKSKEIFESDEYLRIYFSLDEIRIIGEAIEDHRASIAHEPRSIYGKIISEADRDIDFERILIRTIQYAIQKKKITSQSALIKEAYEYMNTKYGPDSGIVFWLNYSKNADNLNHIHYLLRNKNDFEKLCNEIYEKEIDRITIQNLLKRKSYDR